MARIRTIKPDFFFDEEMSALTHEARLFFIGLWTQADRAGRMEDRPAMLKAMIFPYEKINPEACLKALAPKFLIRYEAQGRRFIEINNFVKHQRPHVREPASEIPAPKSTAKAVPQQCLSSASAVPQHCQGSASAVPQQCLSSAQHARKGREGKGSTDSPSPPGGDGAGDDVAFVAFWNAYPRKVGKAAALKVWRRLRPPRALAKRILKAVALQTVSVQWQTEFPRFVPHPTTWLNQGRWDDEPPVRAGQLQRKTAIWACGWCQRGTDQITRGKAWGGAICVDCENQDGNIPKKQVGKSP